MDVHAETADLLGAWALDSCEPDEATRIEEHLRDCPDCAAQARRLSSAASWLGLEHISRPAPGLRESVLAAARARRPPTVLRMLIAAYADQVAVLDEVLRATAPADWVLADSRHATLAGLIAHLAGNDRMLATDLGLPAIPVVATGPATRVAWREQSDLLTRGLERGADLDRQVRLAGAGEPRGPLRDALVQRAFETWTHLEDASSALGRPGVAPPDDQVRRIVDLAARLLPQALAARGVSRPGYAVRLVLDGPGGGEWRFPLDRSAPTRQLTIRASALEFARLVANRRTPEAVIHHVEGDRDLAIQVLAVAATLGCD